MSALDWFESIPTLTAKVADLRSRVESAYASAGPHGMRFGAVGGRGGSHDSMAAVDRLVDTDAAAELDRLEHRLHDRLEQAGEVLYGRSGRGGLARATCTLDADILLMHYCQGFGWAAIAEAAEIGGSNPAQWVKRRALRACRDIDRIGMEELADS